MQHADGPAHVQALPKPPGESCARVKAEPLSLVPRAEGRHRIGGHSNRWWHVGERPAIRSPELEGPVGPTLDLVALLVHRAMVPATEQGEIRQRGWAAVGPMPEMMPLGEAQSAPRETAALVPMVEGTA